MFAQKRKKFVAICLCLTMVLSVLSFGVFAQENTQEAPEKIEITVTDDNAMTVEESEAAETEEEKKIIPTEEEAEMPEQMKKNEENIAEEKENYAKTYHLDELPDPALFAEEMETADDDAVPMRITEKSVLRRHKVAVGFSHSIFLKDNGNVVTWGVYYDEAFADRVENIKNPKDVVGPGYIVSVAASDIYGYALDVDGEVWVWGPEFGSDLGPHTDDEEFPAQQVEGLSDIVAISAEGKYSLALKADGTVWQWGEYDGAEVMETPIPVLDQNGNMLSGIVDISAGRNHGLALSAQGEVYAWGDNFYGQLGDGTRESRTYAEVIRNMEKPSVVTEIEAGDGYNTVKTADGEELAWGKSDQIKGRYFAHHLWTATPLNSADETVNEAMMLSDNLPPGNVVDMAQSRFFSNLGLAICEDGTVWRMGDCDLQVSEEPNGMGGVYTRIDVNVKDTGWIDMPELKSQTQKPYEPSDEIIAASAFNEAHSMAVVDGVLMSSGSNKYGQLGDGTFLSSDEPVPVMNYLNEPMDDVKKVSAGNGYALILNNDGRVWSVGFNEYGKLGDGGSENQNKAYPVRGKNGNGFLRDFVDVAAGYKHSLAVKSDGSVWAWGSNSAGQLGDGTHDMSILPIRVRGANGEDWIKNAVSAYANANCSMVLNADGTVYMWGNNDKGQLGNGNKTNQSIPVQVKGPDGQGVLDGIVQIATAEGCSIALDEDGTVWTWGGNQNGRLGDGTTNDRYYPGKVLKGERGEGVLDDIVAISAGYYFNAALDSKGFVWVWGKNDKGQLGNGTTQDQYKAVQVQDPGIISGYISGIRSISCGKEYTLATDADGNKLAWGYNRYGQFGTGNTGNTWTTPGTAFQVTNGTKDIVWLNQQMKNYTNVTGNINLPVSCPNGSTVTWTSGRPDLLTNDGNLLNTPVFDTEVILVANMKDTSGNTKTKNYTVTVPSNVQGFSETYTQNFTGTASSAGSEGSTQIDALPMWTFSYPGISNGMDGKVHTGQVLGKDGYLTLKKTSQKQTGDSGECVTGQRSLQQSTVASLKSVRIGFTAKAYATGNIYFAPMSVTGVPVCEIGLNGADKKIEIKRGQNNNGAVTVMTQQISEYDPTVEHKFEIYLAEDGSLMIVIDGNVIAEGCQLPEAGNAVPVNQWKTWVTNAADTGDAGSIKNFVVDQAVYDGSGENILTVNSQKDKEYIVNLNGKNIKSFAGKIYTIQYDANVFSLEDGIARTLEKEMTVNMEASGIKITNIAPGLISFSCTKEIPENMMFSGFMNGICLKAKQSGTGTIRIVVQ